MKLVAYDKKLWYLFLKQIHERRLKQYRDTEKKYLQTIPDLPVEQQYKYMTLRRGILLEQAWLAWCEEVENFLSPRYDAGVASNKTDFKGDIFW